MSCGGVTRGVILRRLHRAERELDHFNLLYLGRLVRWDSLSSRYRPLDERDPLCRLAADVGDLIHREIVELDALAHRCAGIAEALAEGAAAWGVDDGPED